MRKSSSFFFLFLSFFSFSFSSFSRPTQGQNLPRWLPNPGSFQVRRQVGTPDSRAVVSCLTPPSSLGLPQTLQPSWSWAHGFAIYIYSLKAFRRGSRVPPLLWFRRVRDIIVLNILNTRFHTAKYLNTYITAFPPHGDFWSSSRTYCTLFGPAFFLFRPHHGTLNKIPYILIIFEGKKTQSVITETRKHHKCN